MDDLVLNMAFFAVGPEVLLRILGPCAVPEALDRDFSGFPPIPLEERIGLSLRPADTSPPTTE